MVANETEVMFDGSQHVVNDLRLQRGKLMVEVADQLMTIQAETEIAEKEADTWYGRSWESVKSTVKEGFASIWNPIVELRNRMQVSLQLLTQAIMEHLAVCILRIFVYIIFFFQFIFSLLLIFL